MCLCAEFGVLIFGIITLIRGRFLLTRFKEVRGWPARIIGLLLILPLPASFSIGILIGTVYAALGKNTDVQAFGTAATLAEIVIFGLFFFSAIGVAFCFAEPIRKKRSEPDDVVLPADDEPFQPGSLDKSRSQGITGGPSRPSTSPDDRIQREGDDR